MPDKSDPQHLYSPDDFDFRLKPGSRAMMRASPLPTINDDFTGNAPDLGAPNSAVPCPTTAPAMQLLIRNETANDSF